MTPGRLLWTIVLATSLLLTDACNPASVRPLPAGLTVEEHALSEAPILEPLTFQPEDGSMDAILARHATERSKVIPLITMFLGGRFAIRTAAGSDVLTAAENYGSDGSTGWVTVTRGDREIYSIDTGMASPVTALRGLWLYDNHWVLETAHITHDSIGGQVSRDGEVLNDRNGYDEAFGFQLMHSRPFYFFKKDGKLGFSYDGQDVRADYDEIPHYGCCSASALNARQAENMVAFFTRRHRTWYYVEVGVFR